MMAGASAPAITFTHSLHNHITDSRSLDTGTNAYKPVNVQPNYLSN
jgi:hypothetical protein